MCSSSECSPNTHSDKLRQNTYTYSTNGEAITLQKNIRLCTRVLVNDPSTNGNEKPLVLASSSPRRHELIKALDAPISIQGPISKEGARLHQETPEKYTLRLALGKVIEIASQNPDSIILGADTIVSFRSEIMGKPTGKLEAIRMLSLLRGRKHRVITTVVVMHGDSRDWFGVTKTTDVKLRKYSNAEVSNYVTSGSPLDKAGSYAIQDRTFNPAEFVVGCYLNVIGLPMCEVPILLQQSGRTTAFRSNWTPPKECLDCELRIHQEFDKR